MDNYLKITASVLIAAILVLQLEKQQKDMAAILRIAVCVLACFALLNYIRPVFDFLMDLEQTGDLRSDYLMLLVKALGIGLITEIASLVCVDAGSASLGKIMNIFGAAVILFLSLPVYKGLIGIVQQIVGES